VQSATPQALARYWSTGYDWRRCEARLNAVPRFTTGIGGVDVHFLHVRSRRGLASGGGSGRTPSLSPLASSG
jgi:hypothetical protein